MYLSSSFYDRCEIKIPSELILDMTHKYDLPVYVVLYLAYTPFCKEPFSAKRVLELSRVSRSLAVRNKAIADVAGSLLRLQSLGYIRLTYCNDISLAESAVKSRFLFQFVERERAGNYLTLGASECDAVLDGIRSVNAEDCKCSLCTLFHIYCLFRLNSFFWQSSYEEKYPAWVGTMREIYLPLRIKTKAMSDGVRALRESGIVTVCYGAGGGEDEHRAKTIVVFNLTTQVQAIDSVIDMVKARYNKGRQTPGIWHPPNIPANMKSHDEAGV